MTVENQTKKVTATGNGSAFTFSFNPIVIFAQTDLEVVTTVIATGVETVRTLGTGATNFSVSVGSFPGTGSITFPADESTALPATETITIRRVLTLEQTTDLENQGGYNPETLEQALDKVVMQNLQQQEEIERSILLPVSFTVPDDTITDAPATGEFLGFDGTKFIWSALSTTTANASDATPQADGTPAAGSSTDFSRADHVHRSELSSDTTPQLAGPLDTNSQQVRWSKGADVASASALTLGTDGNYFDITGTTAITSIGTLGIGTVVRLHFDAALTLTHNATDLVLPGAANITTAAGDEATFVEYASGDWRCVSYQAADGEAVVNPLPQEYMSGGSTLILSNDTDTAHDINVTAGAARDSANGENLVLTSEITKQIDATFVAGDDAGGLSSSLTAPANNTWYHVFLISISGTIDVGFDTSVTAANLVTDHSVTAFRRLGSVKTDGSANIKQFKQYGNRFQWDFDELADAEHTVTNSGANGTAVALDNVPDGIVTLADVSMAATGGASTAVYDAVRGDDTVTTLPAVTESQAGFGNNTDGQANMRFFWPTDSSQQIKVFSTTTGMDFDITVQGWVDFLRS